MDTHLEENSQDQIKSHILFRKKPLQIDYSLWNSLTQMESHAVTKLAIASLKKAVNSRQNEDSTILLFFLKDIPIIQTLETEFDRSELLQLITAMRYEQFNNGDEIYHQGEKIPSKLFFILSGQCLAKTVEILEQQESEGNQAIQQISFLQKKLKERDTFGEDSLTQQTDTISVSQYTITVETEGLECAVLNQEVYLTLKRNVRQKTELAKMRLIKQCPIFKGHLTNKQAFVLRKCFQSRLFSYRQTVYSEGDIPSSVFIVKAGRFRLTKRVTFNYNFEPTSQTSSHRTSLFSKEQNVVVIVEGGCFGDEELVKHIDTRVYSVICESAEGELLEISAKDFFKTLAQEINQDDFKAIKILPSVQYDWRYSNATNSVSVQEKYLEYLAEPPRQAYEAKQIFTRRNSPLINKRSISEQKQFRIEERQASNTEKVSSKREHFYYNYYKKEDVRFFNDEEFCYQPKSPENISFIQENSSKTTFIRRRSTVSALAENNAMKSSSDPQKQYTNQIQTSRPSRRYQSSEPIQQDQKNNQIIAKQIQSTLPIEYSLHNKQQIRQNSQIRSAGHSQNLVDVSKKFIQLHKAKCRNFSMFNGGINVQNNYVPSIAEVINNNNKNYQLTPRQASQQVKTINTKKGQDEMIVSISKTVQHPNQASQGKKTEQVHFSFQEMDVAALEKREILKRKKKPYFFDSSELHSEADRGKRILDNYIVNYSGNKKGSQSGSENKNHNFEGQVNNEQVDANIIGIRGMLHGVNSPYIDEKEIFREQKMVKNRRLLNQKLYPIRKNRAILKNLISL